MATISRELNDGVTAGRHPTIWFVSELYWPEETSTGYFVTRIAEDIATQRPVRAICSQPTYAARGTKAPTREQLNGVDIERVRSTALNKDNLLLRGVNALTFSAAVFARALRRLRRGDLVVALTNPPLLPYVVRVAATLRGARFLLLVHDVYPEVLVATGAARADATMVRVLHAGSRWLYRSAERIIVLGRDMDTVVSRKLPTRTTRTVIIPNWGDTERVQPHDDGGAAVRRRLRLDQKFVLEYMGNMGRTHDLASLIEAADLLRDARTHFLFIGWGAQKQFLEREIDRRHLQEHVTLQAACAADDVSAYLAACDVGVISLRRGMAGISVPSRLYNVMAAGRPVLALTDPDSELAQLITEEAIGWTVPPEDPAALTDVICQLQAAPDELAAAGARARALALSAYSRRAVARQWTEMLDQLTLSRGTMT